MNVADATLVWGSGLFMGAGIEIFMSAWLYEDGYATFVGQFASILCVLLSLFLLAIV